jgi:hypothetical protein
LDLFGNEILKHIYSKTGWYQNVYSLTLSLLMSHICGVSKTAAVQQRVTVVLRSIPKETFADSFQKLYERCQPCVVKDGDYFEGQ